MWLDVDDGLKWGGTNPFLFTELGGVCAGFRSARSDYPPVGLTKAKRSLHERNGLGQVLYRTDRYCMLGQHKTERVWISSWRERVSVKCSMNSCHIIAFGNGSAAIVNIASSDFGQ